MIVMSLRAGLVSPVVGGEIGLGCLEASAGVERTAPPEPEALTRDGVPPAWFRAHVAGIWRVVARLGVPAHHVDDIVQETFILAGRRRADIGVGQERGFLIATAVRLSANHRRRAYVRHEVSEGDALDEQASRAPDAEQLLIQKRWRELLENLLGELSEAHRTVFVLFELEGLSVPEISELLEIPGGTVSSRLTRARARFSELAEAARAQRKGGEP
jgi:RNA polymerase sigma-70 factor (ECF subfamily)